MRIFILNLLAIPFYSLGFVIRFIASSFEVGWEEAKDFIDYIVENNK